MKLSLLTALAALASAPLAAAEAYKIAVIPKGTTHEFWNAIHADARRGRTVIFATHYLDEADAYADRIILVRKGRIVADGSSAEIKSLASGRTVRASVSGLDQGAVAALPGVDSVELRAGIVSVHSKDSDAVARYLLNHTDAKDLEVTSHNLEDAFLALTSDD